MGRVVGSCAEPSNLNSRFRIRHAEEGEGRAMERAVKMSVSGSLDLVAEVLFKREGLAIRTVRMVRKAVRCSAGRASPRLRA